MSLVSVLRAPAVACLCATAALLTACETPSGSHWWMLQADALHSGRSPGEELRQNIGLRWERVLFAENDVPLTAPVFGVDRIFLASGPGDAQVYALSLEDGSVLWKHEAGERGWFVAAPAYWKDPEESVLGRVYVASAGARPRVYALDAGTGGVVWSTPLDAEVRAAVAVSQERVFVHTVVGRVHALSRTTGELLWTATAGSALPEVHECSPAVALGLVIVAAGDQLHAYREINGTILWDQYIGQGEFDRNWSCPVVMYHSAEGYLVVFTDQGHALYAVTIAEGLFIYSMVGSSPAAQSVYAPLYDGNVIIRTRGISIEAWDTDTLTFRWKHYLPGGDWVRASPAIYSGIVFFVARFGLHGIRLSDGTETLFAPISGDPGGPISVRAGDAIAIDRRLIVVRHLGRVLAFEFRPNLSAPKKTERG